MKKHLTMATILMVVLGLGVGAALQLKPTSAQAATAAPMTQVSGPREGSDGNNVVCNGVPSKAMLMYYAHGGVDSCGHRDIKAIWAHYGITPQVTKMMVSGVVCSSGGFISEGRHHSPSPSADRRFVAAGGTVYDRPLSVWGSACYNAWVGHTEDGRTVAVLKGCGNGETTHVPPKPRPVPKPRPGRVPIWIRKQAFSAATEEQLIYPTPTNVFRFEVVCGLHGKPRFIVYQSDPQYAGTCPVNSGRVRIWELSTLGPDKWQVLSPAYQTFNLKGKKKILAVYKDKQVKQVTPTTTTTTVPTTTTTTTTVTTTTTPPPTTTTQPPSHSCSIAYIVQKDGRTVQITVATDSNGPNGMISWGDGSLSPGIQSTHTYGSDGTFTASASIGFNDGSHANCSRAVTTRAPQVVSQGNTPGPNPADGQPNPDGTPPASGPADPNGNSASNNQGTQCPDGYTPDGHGNCN